MKTTLKALLYLRDHSIGTDEWTEAGMWRAVRIVLETPEEKLTIKFLDTLLLNASHF